MNLKLVYFIQNKPNIWNPKHPKYTSIEYRDQTYAEFAAQYGHKFTGQAVKNRWTNIRSTFANYLRKLNASHAKGEDYKINWHLWEPCQFLMKVNRTVKDLSQDANVAEEIKNCNLTKQNSENEVSEKNFSNNTKQSYCKEIIENLVKVFKAVQNDAFGLDDTKYGRIVNNIRERIVEGNYLLQLNPDRSFNRRTPEQIENIIQPFDKDKFNFTKVSKDEIIFTFFEKDNEANEHALVVNVSPISRYHSLLCPSVQSCLPQVVTMESLQLVCDIMFIANDRSLRIGFNSLCGLASVNHLHYHLFIEENILPVETVKCKHLKGPVYCFGHDYPVPALVFEVPSNTVVAYRDIFKLVDFLLHKSIAHNIFITRGQSITEDCSKEIVRLIVWPRKSSSGAKQLAAFNVAVLELSGWFPIYDVDSFENIQTEELERELQKWKYEQFDDLCNEIAGQF
ncbi:unnamed protein product, partial [Iphiclides podalirius]